MDKFGSKNVTPFAMYIFEFEHAFSQRDVANMWQNIMPQLGKSFKEAETSICHPVAKNELLSEKDLSNTDLN